MIVVVEIVGCLFYYYLSNNSSVGGSPLVTVVLKSGFGTGSLGRVSEY